jgi:hypothetical protein
MTTQVHATKFRPGKVVIGPRAIGESFYRIVSLQDRSGRIESFDPQSRSWSAAPDTVTFNDVWKAEPVSQFALDKACAMPVDDLDDDDIVPEEAGESGAGPETTESSVH